MLLNINQVYDIKNKTERKSVFQENAKALPCRQLKKIECAKHEIQ